MIVLITGASSGVGLVAARDLARMGAHVLMLCRDPRRGARAYADVAETTMTPALVGLPVDAPQAQRPLMRRSAS
jgi:NAD(P)-dependent dehydrogenase (short-subunit alcohol dehydrogenase family)